MTAMQLDSSTEKHLREVRAAAGILKNAPVEQRNELLKLVSELLSTYQNEILTANTVDVEKAKSHATSAFLDRLRLTPERIKQMQESLSDVIKLPDSIGAIEEQRTLPNGLKLKRVRSPLGVILMIFEARPNVITEALSIAMKSGNALIMRGGSDSLQTSQVIYKLVKEATTRAKLPANVFWGIENPDRNFVQMLMKQNKFIDVLVPRGGDKLIEYVVENATIPIIKNDRGLCHVYLHEDANEEMAINIVENAKTQRPGVCNAMETLLVHEKKKSLLPKIYERLSRHNVEWFGCPETVKILGGKPLVQAATPTSFDTEYLDFKLSCRVVSSLGEALEHIEKHGSRHSESIITQNETAARTFQNSIDAAAVYWNASTRFTDGFQMGLGGELGISTQKLHVRGPVGPRELTSLRWIIDGTGQTRL
jgi:glutamate-5-semialdehyde dehydrogenase